MTADASKRNKFVRQTRDFVTKNNLDGIDIDWEYPGHETNGVADRKDGSSNLLFLRSYATNCQRINTSRRRYVWSRPMDLMDP
jgi:GH18 family chitinase